MYPVTWLDVDDIRDLEMTWLLYYAGTATVCMSVCVDLCMYLYETITFESLDVRSSFLHIPCISMEFGSSLYMKVIGSMSSLGHGSKNGYQWQFMH